MLLANHAEYRHQELALMNLLKYQDKQTHAYIIKLAENRLRID